MSSEISIDFKTFRNILCDLLSSDNGVRTKAEPRNVTGTRSRDRNLARDFDKSETEELVYDEINATDKLFLLLTAVATNAVIIEEAELAAILLRRLLSNEFEEAFANVTPDATRHIKDQLLHQIQQDVSRSLRRRICDAIAELARNCVDEEGNNHWPEFLKFLFDSACSQDPVLRELSLLMFSAVPGIFGNQQSRYIDVIRQMLTQCLRDEASEDVRYAAVKATTSFILAHEKEVLVQKQFGECVHLLLVFLDQTLEDPNGRPEDILRYIIDLAETCPQYFRAQLDFLIQICLKGLCSTACPETCQHLLLEVIVSLTETAPGMVKKLGSKHLPSVISIIFKMMTDIEDDDNWNVLEEEVETDNESNPIVAESSLDRLACGLGGKTLLPLVLNSLPPMLNSTSWKERYAGLMTVSAIGEGCHKQMSALLPQIVDGLLPFLLDINYRVRYAACNAFGQMSSDFAPVFQKKFHEKVIPALLQSIADNTCPRVQAHAGAALVNFFEDCPKNILTMYMESICGGLEVILKKKLRDLLEKGTKLVLEQLVVTLASLADTVEEKFTDYYERFMPYLKFLIQTATQPDFRVLRGKTIECVSLIGLAVGKEKFLADASVVMDLLLKTQTNTTPIADDDPQLCYMIASWARICKILGKAFEPYLPYVMEPVLKAAALKPDIAVLDADDIQVVENNEDWEFVNLGEKHNFGIRTAGLDEKATACQMLVCYARELKEGFAPYVEDTLKLMVPMLKFYFHDGVRMAAGEVLPCLLESAKVRGDVYVQEMWKYIIPHLLQALDSEPESEVLCEIMAAFAQCVEILNCRCLSHLNLSTLMGILNKNLVGHFERADMRAEKRKEEDYDEVLEETLVKEDDDDVYLLSKVADIVCTLLATYKAEFFVYFDEIVPHFVRLLEPSRPWPDRQWSLCVFADVIEYGGPSCSRYQQYFLQPILLALSDESPDVRQTAAYAIGVLAEFGGPDYAKFCSESIPLLVQMINDHNSRSEENNRATENAISAVTKFLKNITSLNMEEMIPVWITWLPIWEDEEEVKYVYNFLCTLLETNNPYLLGRENCNLPKIVQIVADTFLKEGMEASSDVGKRIITLMKDIQNNADLFVICVDQLNSQQREALHAALTAE